MTEDDNNRGTTSIAGNKADLSGHKIYALYALTGAPGAAYCYFGAHLPGCIRLTSVPAFHRKAAVLCKTEKQSYSFPISDIKVIIHCFIFYVKRENYFFGTILSLPPI